MLTILGAGPAGLATAFYAQRAGVPAVVHERAGEVGGMCRTFRLGAHAYDSGAHRLHDRDPEITADLRALLGRELLVCRAPSQIYDGGRFVDFPPTPLDILTAGGRDLMRACLDLAHARLWPRAPESFEDVAVNRFGRSLAERYLLGYSEKLWGVPARQLAPEAVTRRLSGMTVATLLRELLGRSDKARHIDGSFLYPRQGFGSIARALAGALAPGTVRLGAEVVRFVTRRRRIVAVATSDGRVVETPGRVVATLPVTTIARLARDLLPPEARAAAAELRFRSLRLLFLRLARTRVSDNATIYLPDRSACITRLHEPKNRSAAMSPAHETSLVLEIPCFRGDELACAGDGALAARAIDELARIGLVAKGEVLAWRHHWLPSAYPVLEVGHLRALGTLSEALAGALENLDLLGRSACFSYSHLHDQLRWAKDYVAVRLRRAS